ncbi:hypothetical protein CASFOL_040056 [Castilleja foliolosa]|uniref:PAP/OAS1 substrate-binding-related domain-containing protein n=1 Tax=Castilleja foliolosa TaxID=1961234 RepID=A0ABD3BEK7_9LAMI
MLSCAEVDCLIGKDHLFKHSIILIKAWCYYESHVLGAHHGSISTYALETMVLYIFHLFHSTLCGPLARVEMPEGSDNVLECSRFLLRWPTFHAGSSKSIKTYLFSKVYNIYELLKWIISSTSFANNWATAERSARDIIRKVQTNPVSEDRRKKVVDFIQRLIRSCLGAECDIECSFQNFEPIRQTI